MVQAADRASFQTLDSQLPSPDIDRPVISLASAAGDAVDHTLRTSGLTLDLGVIRVRVLSPISRLGGGLRTIYPHLPLEAGPGYVDVTVHVRRGRGLHRFVRKQARFEADGIEIFEPSPQSSILAQFEWGLNWCVAQMLNQYLLLHAGVVEIDGVGVLLVGAPGAGKSTLTAALGLSGARVLSDEFGIVRRHDLAILPIAKPVSLKNSSIELVRARWPMARLGPVIHNTHKGDIAHLAVSEMATALRHRPVEPRLIVFPRWRENATISMEPVGPAATFTNLGANSFNYALLGPEGFATVAKLVDRCASYRFEYDTLDEAVAAVRALAAREACARS